MFVYDLSDFNNLSLTLEMSQMKFINRISNAVLGLKISFLEICVESSV